MAVSIGPKIGIDGEAEYRKQLRNIIQETKTLDKQMGALESSFDDTTDEMEKHQKVLEQLEKKSEALTDAVDKMQDMVDRAVEKYGEGSTEALKWEAALADTEKALADTNKEIENQQNAIEDLQSPMGQLTSEISNQQSELDALKDAYVDAWLNGESDRCAELAGEIENLSGALATNQQAMADAKSEADGFDQTIEKIDGISDAEGKVADGSEKMSGAFGGSISSMASAIATGSITDLIGSIVDKMMEIVDGAIEVQNSFDDAVSTIAVGTGMAGDELDEMGERAKAAWAKVADKDGSVEASAAIIANLNTRLGLTGDSAEEATSLFEKFAKITGEDGADAVNKVVDTMKKWGMVTGDAGQDVETMRGILEQMTVACQTTDTSASQYLTTMGKYKGTFDGLGLSMEDTLALMMQYDDAGGNISEFTNVARTALTKLQGTTDDVGGAFQNAMEIMRGTGDVTDILNTKIGDTGVTIEEAFGGKRAADIVASFQAMNQSSTDWAGTLTSAAGSLQNTYEASITTQDGIKMLSNSIEASTGLNGDFIIEAAKMNGMYQLLATTGTALAASTKASYQDMSGSSSDTTKKTDADAKKQVASAKSIEAGTRSAYSGAANAVQNATSQEISAANAMQSRTASSYNAAAGSVNNACNNMVNSLGYVQANSSIWVSAHGALPYIVDNKGNTAVSYSVAGYTRFARGYDEAMILNSPTLFGLIGGDRPGNEIVVGESHLLDMMRQTVQTAFGYVPAASSTSNSSTTTNNYSNNPVINVYGAPGQDVRELANIIEQKISRNVNRRSAVW